MQEVGRGRSSDEADEQRCESAGGVRGAKGLDGEEVDRRARGADTELCTIAARIGSGACSTQNRDGAVYQSVSSHHSRALMKILSGHPY